MTQLTTKIKIYLNKEIDFRKDVILQDDGNGVYIKEWNIDIAQPTDAQLNALEAQANEIEKINNIRSQRANNYPSLADQLDMQYWDKINGTNKWQQAINAVKQKYPK
jgi:arsenate reductase-like glutaredoxin family protein